MNNYKVAINRCHGGFILSDEAEKLYEKLAGEEFCPYDTPRHCPHLIRVIEELGARASGECSDLQIVDIADSRYRINEYDGFESVETPHTLRWIEIS